MKKRICQVFSLICILCYSNVYASENYSYADFSLGFVKYQGKEIEMRNTGIQNRKFNIKSAPSFNLSYGHPFNNNFRADISLSYLSDHEIKASGMVNDQRLSYKTQAQSIIAAINSYYGFETELDTVHPYITAGIGMGINRINDIKLIHNKKFIGSYQGHTHNKFIWKIGAGIRYDLNDATFLDFGYRFISLGKVKTYNEIDNTMQNIYPDRLKIKSLRAHQVFIGLGFKFFPIHKATLFSASQNVLNK